MRWSAGEWIFSSDANANFKGLLAVNRGLCMTQKSVCRNQRYNTLDFAEQNRVPAWMLAPLLETQRQKDAPFAIPHFPRRCIYKLQKTACIACSENAKEAVLSHNTRVVELLPFIELQHRTGFAKPVQYPHSCRLIVAQSPAGKLPALG